MQLGSLRVGLTLILFSFVPANILAESEKVNLVLGGGGAKAFVHIGIIESLANHNVEISSVIGTSGGALIGGLYVFLVDVKKMTPKSAVNTLKQWCFAKDFGDFMDGGIFRSIGWYLRLRSSKYKGDALLTWLKEKVGGVRLSELRLPLIITATDRFTGGQFFFAKQSTMDMVWNTERDYGLDPRSAEYADAFSTVELQAAIRASSSIQGYFPPVRISGREFWDGGNVGNTRVDIGWKLNPIIPTVAVSITYRNTQYAAENWSGILNHTIDVMMARIDNKIRELTNVVIPKERKGKLKLICLEPIDQASGRQIGTLDFHLTNSEKVDLIKNRYELMNEKFHPQTGRLHFSEFCSPIRP